MQRLKLHICMEQYIPTTTYIYIYKSVHGKVVMTWTALLQDLDTVGLAWCDKTQTL